MKSAVRVTWVTIALLVATARPAGAQSFVQPWFNGVGVSAGGGPLRFRGGGDDPLVALIRPENDTLGAAAMGVFLSLGSQRWAVLLPELHSLGASIKTEGIIGALTLDSRTVTFEPEYQSIDAFAVLFGAQGALLPNGRVWVRGGIGSGWISRHIEAKDQGITVDLSTSENTGLALSGAAGVSVWARQLEGRRATSIDVELHYVAVRAGQLRVAMPSVRVGWRFFPITL